MSLIYVNGTGYADNDAVPWHDAVAAGGFYFGRALTIGLPRPPAILFDRKNPGYHEAMLDYHRKFVWAEARRIGALSEEDEPDLTPWRHQEDGF